MKNQHFDIYKMSGELIKSWILALKHKLRHGMPMMDDLDGRKSLLKASGLKKGRILDIGLGGCGCMSFFLAKKKGFDVIGIDSSPHAVYTARKDVLKEKLKGSFQAKQANAENLPFSDHEFDAVIAYHSLHHVDHVSKAIKEIFRVCKKDGLVIISDLNAKGRKTYDHELDGGRFIKKIEKLLNQYTESIRKIGTKYNVVFICRN